MLASPLFGLAVASLAITGIIKLVDYLNSDYERQIEKLNTLNSEYDSMSSKLNESESKLKSVKDRMTELLDLQKTGKITFVEQKELDNLKQTNEQLEIQIKNEQELLRIKGKEKEEQALNLINSTKTVMTPKVDKYTKQVSYSAQDVNEIQEVDSLISAYEDLNRQKKELDKNDSSYTLKLERLNSRQSELHTQIINSTNSINEQGKSIIGATDEGKKMLTNIENLNKRVVEHTSNFKVNTGAINDESKAIKDGAEAAKQSAFSQEKFNNALDDSTKL
jgi:peptidoglycan hydrolase CwlO-like protein